MGDGVLVRSGEHRAMNLALTAMAHALRVGHHLLSRLGKEG
jgi:hypothetical protein